ncbi:chemotaxis protein CheC [Eubacterium oxidoreducens]|uniref:Chemotaxis protein CheC n=1 Tax=Eubacterium oxidoreducens TaxID=1732 RepID=A0A1G6APM5_EUBOX|nr:chemotaxis protein CheC [Eubacterium oxidoreducens]SDB10315.1 chemotaxis protein CheC [Eubacterium oxidoreducens]
MAENTFDNINSMYLDVLKEIGNIGAGNATTAIASMLGFKVDMSVPSVKLMECQELPTAIGPEEDVVAGIYLEVMEDISGSMMFILSLPSAQYLVNKLMMRDPEYSAPFDEMDMSALKEIGNIIGGSYLSALSGLTGLTIAPSVPALAIDMEAAVLSVPAIVFGQMGDNALLIETKFGDDVMIDGYFILMPDVESYEKILTALGIQV